MSKVFHGRESLGEPRVTSSPCGRFRLAVSLLFFQANLVVLSSSVMMIEKIKGSSSSADSREMMSSYRDY